MLIRPVTDPAFKTYGRIVDLDFSGFLSVLPKKYCPDDGVFYTPEDADLSACPEVVPIARDVFGGLDIEVGYCAGHNRILNALEYHVTDEINVMVRDAVLILGHVWDIEGETYDTAKCEAFFVPAGVGVFLYATTLHYAPCDTDGKGFYTAVVLPAKTNTEKPKGSPEKALFGCNKFLYAHPDSPEAKQGAHIGLKGENLKI